MKTLEELKAEESRLDARRADLRDATRQWRADCVERAEFDLAQRGIVPGMNVLIGLPTGSECGHLKAISSSSDGARLVVMKIKKDGSPSAFALTYHSITPDMVVQVLA